MLLNKYKRTNFLKEAVTESGDEEWDMILSNWDLFELNHPVTFGVTLASDIGRPDIISYRIYGTSKYWWILCKVNQIDDLWNDLYIGMDLIIPAVADIQNYYASVREMLRG